MAPCRAFLSSALLFCACYTSQRPCPGFCAQINSGWQTSKEELVAARAELARKSEELQVHGPLICPILHCLFLAMLTCLPLCCLFVAMLTCVPLCWPSAMVLTSLSLWVPRPPADQGGGAEGHKRRAAQHQGRPGQGKLSPSLARTPHARVPLLPRHTCGPGRSLPPLAA